MSLTDHRVVSDTKVDPSEELNRRVTVDGRGERIYVEFSSQNPRLKVQKNFQNNIFGKRQADAFAESMKSVADLKAYFKIKE